MALELRDISDEDRSYFEKRLANYGLDLDAITTPDLITMPATITRLSARRGSATRLSPITLTTSDFDDVNRWIGLPDALAEKMESPVIVPRPLRFPNMNLRKGESELRGEDAVAKMSVRDLSLENLSVIRKAADAYLYGDSVKAQEYKPWIEKVYSRVDIAVWALLTVTVKSGSVLEFGPGANVLTAFRVVVEEGAIIRSYGHLKIDAVFLKKSQPKKAHKIDPALMQVGMD